MARSICGHSCVFFMCVSLSKDKMPRSSPISLENPIFLASFILVAESLDDASSGIEKEMVVGTSCFLEVVSHTRNARRGQSNSHFDKALGVMSRCPTDQMFSFVFKSPEMSWHSWTFGPNSGVWLGKSSSKTRF